MLLFVIYISEHNTWTPVVRERFLSANLETSYLHMTTSSSSVENGETMVVGFYDIDLWRAGGLAIWFRSSSSIKYILVHCMQYYTNFPVTLPADPDKTWVISKRGKTTKVYCNGKMVLEVTASSEICDKPDYESKWETEYGREANSIYFPTFHTATESYYIGTRQPL